MTYAKSRLEELCKFHPELFPEAFGWDYALCGFTDPFRKQELRCRRIRLEQGGEVFTVAPAFVMPYVSSRTDAVEQALCLMRFHVPCWAIAEVFGRDLMYGYRLEQGLGRLSLVGTTIKRTDGSPTDWVADEKHSWLKGQRVAIATIAGQDCMLGASVSPSAGQADLKVAYGIFAEAARALDPAHAPQSAIRTGGSPRQARGKPCFQPCVSQTPSSHHESLR